METSETKDRSWAEKSMTLGHLCKEAGMACPEGAGEICIRGITADTRRVRPGWLFIAIRGMHVDARQLLPQALAAGAAAVVYQPGPQEVCTPDGVCVPVDNVRRAMAYLFDAWYDHPGRRLRLVGVTGTNGKTTVTHMLSHLLQAAGVPTGRIGTLGAVGPAGPVEDIRPVDERAAMTTPDPEELYAILDRMASAPCANQARVTVVMEVTSHALALEKVAPLHFDLAVFTNLTPEHLDFHGTVENCFEAKRKLFTAASAAVVNTDDPWGRLLVAQARQRASDMPVRTWYLCHEMPPELSEEVCTEGLACVHGWADQRRTLGLDGVEYCLMTPDTRLRLTCPMPGPFTVMNSMQATMAALALGVSPSLMKEAVAGFQGIPGRMERVSLPGADFALFIDFAHTPDALEHLLLTFHQLRAEADAAAVSTRRRLVVLFGCGGDRDRSKRKIMARIASRMADVVVITSDNSRSESPEAIIQDILSGIDKESEYVVIQDRAQAIRHTIRYARTGDIILLCGKGHETYEIDATGRHPFCERALALDAWRDRMS